MIPPIPSAEHYDYGNISGCQCPLCLQVLDYAGRYNALSSTISDHPCGCRCEQHRELATISKQLRGANVQRDLYSELTFGYRNRENPEYCAERAFIAIHTYPGTLNWWGLREDRLTVKQWRTLLNLP
jgi:hypothetical protein